MTCRPGPHPTSRTGGRARLNTGDSSEGGDAHHRATGRWIDSPAGGLESSTTRTDRAVDEGRIGTHTNTPRTVRPTLATASANRDWG